MTTTADLVQVLSRVRVVPVVRAGTADRATRIVEALVSAGIEVVELTTTIPDWRTVLRQVRAAYPEVTVGMGTVVDADAARSACGDGAQFLVTPFTVPEVRGVARENETALIAGGLTPAEIHQGASGGIAKLFPAHVGGPAYLRSVRAVLPGAHIIPTGGITVDSVAEWLAAGALAVGVGSDLYESPDLHGTVDRLRQAIRDARA